MNEVPDGIGGADIHFGHVKPMKRQLTQVASKSFDDLLTKFQAARYRELARAATNTSSVALFLDEYKAVSERVGAALERQVVRHRAAFNQILDDYEAYWEHWQKTQRTSAERFNVLSVLGLEGHELCHIRVLSWLLARDARWYGTHSQGSRGFEIFLERLGLPPAYALGKYRVRTEVPGLHSRIDVEIAEPGISSST